MTHPSMAIHDVQGLTTLLADARRDGNKALPEAARQFEALFLQTLLNTMRSSQKVLDEDSPFRSAAQDTFQEMLDGQFAMEISQGKGIGLSQMMIQQLSKQQASEPSEIKPLISAPIALGLSTQQKANQPTEINPLSAPASLPPAKDSTNLADYVIDFVKQLKPYAEQAASVLGIDEKMLIAQAALETGWGVFTAKDSQGNSSHNLFNIKAKQTDSNAVKIKTTEFLADKPIKMNQYFKRYDNMEESFKDFVNLIKGSQRYQEALNHHGNSEHFIQGLQKAGYATDPSYADKILQIYRNPNLQAAMEHVANVMQQGDKS
ncbi:flagellar assembly peptidoglycan hydrolase FlgJ [Legionella sp. W05-934-2]|jgi:flagellar protein FlgJ|uniref:flagellar assembly peptidoglycan hydrolase FlgJ n=1 Tax=Legionella sp. W05-934-2 TaxID=1198649 RepID=UPI003462E689